MKRSEINICYLGNEQEDVEFVSRIVARFQQAYSIELIDLNALEKDPSFRRRITISPVTIYIISRSLVKTSIRRQRLVASAPGRNLPGRMVSYICRDIKVEELRKLYPDLEGLFNDVLIGDASQLDNLNDEIVVHLKLESSRTNFLFKLGLIPKVVISTLLILSGNVVIPGYFIIVTIVLFRAWYNNIFGTVNAVEQLQISVALAFGVGIFMNRIPIFDFFPWAGSERNVSMEEWIAAAREWTNWCRGQRFGIFVKLSFLCCPVLAELSNANSRWTNLIAMSFVFGLLWPVVYFKATQFKNKWVYKSEGLTPKEIARTEQFFGYMRGPWKNLILHTHKLRRRWFRPADYVFISYSWKDEEERPIAQQLADTLKRRNVPYYLDKEKIVGKFSPWRSELTGPLIDATHVFVIIGKNSPESDAQTKEVRTAFNRWQTEGPSIRCLCRQLPNS